MRELVVIFFGMALVNNFVLVRFLGLCPFFGVSTKLTNALSMGVAVLLVMLVASAVTWPIYHLLLVPYQVEFMETVIFILVIAVLVQIIEITIRRTNLTLYRAFGIYLPLITTNCAVLGLAFINIRHEYTFFESIFASLGAGIGFTLVLIIMSGLRERLEITDLPHAFTGTPIAFIIAMFLGLAFLAFAGMIG
ncbi:RnfABCDGE type electron transport complex subunit A [Candidatus Acetothermia bacterium]|nr:RnfABCDGE type electron transport complex subunit A [Candidatus Acetothermia bacterium]MCI2427648.1 RnfABCDGE type electron transport complex subunit A [Candidatus Acetothermia bacterium]MCI2428835.1 RnfABCDGE type electron transport complex subunit A [Candidatus Acetothermia bacterium]